MQEIQPLLHQQCLACNFIVYHHVQPFLHLGIAGIKEFHLLISMEFFLLMVIQAIDGNFLHLPRQPLQRAGQFIGITENNNHS
ncbi:hypothetical protein D3Z45_12315 [Lachnospiraceae bacterium]|nr:hypothetical protein [Lachnospiraceae bacterium]